MRRQIDVVQFAGTCEVTGKRRFRSHRAAVRASRNLREQLVAYLCPDCHFWHAGHRRTGGRA